MLDNRVDDAVEWADRAIEAADRHDLPAVRLAALVERATALVSRRESIDENIDRLLGVAEDAAAIGEHLIASRALHNAAFLRRGPVHHGRAAGPVRAHARGRRPSRLGQAVDRRLHRRAHRAGVGRGRPGRGGALDGRQPSARRGRRVGDVDPPPHHQAAPRAGGGRPRRRPRGRPPGPEWRAGRERRGAPGAGRARVRPEGGGRRAAGCARGAGGPDEGVDAHAVARAGAARPGSRADRRRPVARGRRASGGGVAPSSSRPSTGGRGSAPTSRWPTGDVDGAIERFAEVFGDPEIERMVWATDAATDHIGAARALLLGRREAEASAHVDEAARLLARWDGWRVRSVEALQRRLGPRGRRPTPAPPSSHPASGRCSPSWPRGSPTPSWPSASTSRPGRPASTCRTSWPSSGCRAAPRPRPGRSARVSVPSPEPDRGGWL